MNEDLPNAHLEFWQRRALSSIDQVAIEIWTPQTNQWVIVASYDGLDSDWALTTVDLSAYRGQSIRLRWRVETPLEIVDGEIVNSESSFSYAIDDVTVTCHQ